MDQKFKPLPFTLYQAFALVQLAVLNGQVGKIYAGNPDYQTGARTVLAICLVLLAIYTAMTCRKMFTTGLNWFARDARLTDQSKWSFSGLVCAHGVIFIGLGLWMQYNGRAWGLLLPAVDILLTAWVWLTCWPKEK